MIQDGTIKWKHIPGKALPQATEKDRYTPFVVAIEDGAFKTVCPGTFKRGKIAAIGCSMEPYAWAYVRPPKFITKRTRSSTVKP